MGVGDSAVAAMDPHQAFVEGGLAPQHLDHRLEAERDPPFVERGHDLVGGAHAFAAQRVALDIGPVGDERAVALGARGGERVLRAAQDFRHAAGMARRRHPADRHRHRHRAGGGRDGLVAHAGQQALGGDRQFVGRATGQDHAEFVAGEAAEMILAAQPGLQALGDLRDHVLGDVEAVGFVEVGEMVDGDQQETARAAKAHGLFQRRAEHLQQMGAV